MYSGEERRTYHRAKTLLSIVYYDGTKFFKEFVHDISAGGLLIKSGEPCDVGAILDMAVDFSNPTIRAKGTVAWIKKDNTTYRMGIQLKEINADAANAWAGYLNRLLGLTA
ncbi:MAG: PilZ domain-containing protein [Pseudomonadota bacterium]